MSTLPPAQAGAYVLPSYGMTPREPKEIFAFYRRKETRDILTQCLAATSHLRNTNTPLCLSRKESGLPRTVLYFPTPRGGERYVLMTRRRKEGDMPVAVMTNKAVKVAIDESRRLWTVVVRRCNGHEGRSMPPSLFERVASCARIVLPRHQMTVPTSYGSKRYEITRYYNQGDLLMLLTNPQKRLTPEDVQRICRQLLETVESLHKQKLVHRDIKIENVFLERTLKGKIEAVFGDPDHLADAEFFARDGWLAIGTTCNLPPDVEEMYRSNKKPFGLDTWALGSVLFTLVTGHYFLSFFEDSRIRKEDLERCFLALERVLELSATSPLSFLIPIIRAFLHRDPLQRISVETALRSINWDKKTVLLPSSNPTPAADSAAASPAAPPPEEK